jgi:hypothetical protein
MKNEFEQLLGPLKELVAVKDELLKLVSKGDGKKNLKLSTDRFHGQIAPISFRTYQGVADDFRAFAAGIMGMKNQDLVAQALIEFMDRYKELSQPPISLVLGEGLCALEEKEKIFSRMIMGIRFRLFEKSGATAPQVRVFDNKFLGKNEFVIKVDDGREFTGLVKNANFDKIKLQIESLMKEKTDIS